MICAKCRCDKSPSDFYSSNRSKCKECVKEEVRTNRANKIEQYREYDRQRGNRPDRLAASAAYQQTDAGRARANAGKRAYIKRNKEKRAAHVILGNAIKSGIVVPLPCEVCGEQHAEAHHAAYSLPLDVTWLCSPHHKQVHKEHRAYLRTH